MRKYDLNSSDLEGDRKQVPALLLLMLKYSFEVGSVKTLLLSRQAYSNRLNNAWGNLFGYTPSTQKRSRPKAAPARISQAELNLKRCNHLL